jgi:hypothetical protein
MRSAMIQWAQKYIQAPPKSKRVKLTISRVLDALEKRRFQHLTQYGQGFFEVQYQPGLNSF